MTKEVTRGFAAAFTGGLSELIQPKPFGSAPDPANPNAVQGAAPSELKKEEDIAAAQAAKEKAKAARRVKTILTGPSGLEDQVNKKLLGNSVLLGGGTKAI